MGYQPRGSDLDPRMVRFSQRNLEWLGARVTIEVADATTAQWSEPAAVVSETFLGPPMTAPPSAIELQAAQQQCSGVILGWLKNLAPQLASGTPVVFTAPAWLKPGSAALVSKSAHKSSPARKSATTPNLDANPSGEPNSNPTAYSRLNLLDEVRQLGYNVIQYQNLSQDDLLYHRAGQVVAREIIVLRKK